MAGASDSALEKGRFLLQEMSDADKLYLVPGGIGAGSNMKMVHQVLAGIHILGASEAQGFAAQLGLDAVKTSEAIKSSGSHTWMHENRLQRMLEEDWHPGASALTIILKDVVSKKSMAFASVISNVNRGVLGNHHHFCAPKSISHASMYHRRAGLPVCFVAGLRTC